jgi:hypothetical protein
MRIYALRMDSGLSQKRRKENHHPAAEKELKSRSLKTCNRRTHGVGNERQQIISAKPAGNQQDLARTGSRLLFLRGNPAACKFWREQRLERKRACI